MCEQPEKSEWSMSDERAFLENLLCARFNFFLLFFSLVVAGALTASDPVHFRIVLSLGALISIPFAGTIARAQAKLDIALQELFANEAHPAKKLDKKCPGISMRKWIGYWIPLICCMVLALGAILALCNGLGPAAK